MDGSAMDTAGIYCSLIDFAYMAESMMKSEVPAVQYYTYEGTWSSYGIPDYYGLKLAELTL